MADAGRDQSLVASELGGIRAWHQSFHPVSDDSDTMVEVDWMSMILTIEPEDVISTQTSYLEPAVLPFDLSPETAIALPTPQERRFKEALFKCQQLRERLTAFKSPAGSSARQAVASEPSLAKVPVCIRVTGPTKDSGVYYHHPQNFNHDVYKRADGHLLYYYFAGASMDHGSWRTAGEGHEDYANPGSKFLGFGLQYPLGLEKVAYDLRFTNATDGPWSMHFEFVKPEVALKPDIPEVSEALSEKKHRKKRRKERSVEGTDAANESGGQHRKKRRKRSLEGADAADDNRKTLAYGVDGADESDKKPNSLRNDNLVAGLDAADDAGNKVAERADATEEIDKRQQKKRKKHSTEGVDGTDESDKKPNSVRNDNLVTGLDGADESGNKVAERADAAEEFDKRHRKKRKKHSTEGIDGADEPAKKKKKRKKHQEGSVEGLNNVDDSGKKKGSKKRKDHSTEAAGTAEGADAEDKARPAAREDKSTGSESLSLSMAIAEVVPRLDPPPTVLRHSDEDAPRQESAWIPKLCRRGPQCQFLARGFCQYHHPAEHLNGGSWASNPNNTSRQWNVLVNKTSGVHGETVHSQNPRVLPVLS